MTTFDRPTRQAPAGPGNARSLGEAELAELASELQKLPKAELHRHLPGSYRLQTLLELAREYRLDLPTYDLEGLRQYAQVQPGAPANLGHILRTVSTFLRQFFVTREAIARFAFEMVEDAWRDGIVYLESRFSPWVLSVAHGHSFDDVLMGAAQGVAAAQRLYPVQTGMLLGVTREAGLAVASQLADYALDVAGTLGVVGVDLAGDEEMYPPRQFAGVFERIRADGRLGITIHAGEAAGPDSVRAAVETLGAQRIGHGVRVIEDAETTEFVRARGIVLETCPTSNVATGAVGSFAAHPLKPLLARGVAATINTDDPGWFDISLTGEYLVSLTRLGLTFDELRQAAIHAAAGAFLPDPARAALVARIGNAYAAAAPRITALLSGG